MTRRAPTSPARPGMRMRRMTPARLVRALSLLQAGAWTIPQLAAEADLPAPTLRAYVNAMRGARPRMVRVAEWVQVRIEPPLYVAAYTLGSERDAQRPPKRSSAERCRVWRARKKQRALDAVVLGVGR